MPSTIHHNVVLKLISDEETYELNAEIRIDNDVMVISVREEMGPYLIRGKRVGHFFAGNNETADAGEVDLVARWCELGDLWVGWWCENGYEYLFNFRLPKVRNAPVKSAGGRQKKK